MLVVAIYALLEYLDFNFKSIYFLMKFIKLKKQQLTPNLTCCIRIFKLIIVHIFFV